VKITKTQLRQIIKEELEAVVSEEEKLLDEGLEEEGETLSQLLEDAGFPNRSGWQSARMWSQGAWGMSTGRRYGDATRILKFGSGKEKRAIRDEAINHLINNEGYKEIRLKVSGGTSHTTFYRKGRYVLSTGEQGLARNPTPYIGIQTTAVLRNPYFEKPEQP
jgi:hypothetical protein